MLNVGEFRPTEMFIFFIILVYASSHSGLAQIYEGSAGDSGDTIKERFVEATGDPVVDVDSNEYGNCVPKPFPGFGLNFKGNVYEEMFICPNGFIGLTDENMQNWPYDIGTLFSQQNSAFLAPYWSRVDLSAFESGESKVRFNSYHTDFNNNALVFNSVNKDVRSFTGKSDFEASWAAVITWENIKPHDAGDFGGKNQFQAVIVSDENSWYVMYNYADIDWAVKAPREKYRLFESQSGLPVMGWNAGKRGFDYNNKEQYENLPLSGSIHAEDIDDYRGNLGTAGKWIFDVGQSGPKSADLLCYEWYKGESVVSPNPRLQCPTTFFVARLDRRFRGESSSRRGRCFVNVLPRTGSAVRCCYNRRSGSLIKSFPDAGSVLSRNPWYFITNDEYGYTKCCLESDRCEAYFARNFIQLALLYKAPHWAWGFGDPHYENMDRMNYTFNGCGEFMFLDGNNSQIQIQVRFTRATGAGGGTVISAVVIKKEPFHPIQINLKLGGGVLFLVNGTEYPGSSSFNTTPVIIQDSISVVKPAANQLIITMEDGSGIEIKDDPNNLIITVVLENGLFGKTTGLLGNWSGTTDDDFLLPNGTILPPTLTDEQIHFDYGEKWRLTPGQSLFVNTTADANFGCPADYTPIFLTNYTFSNSTLEAEAKAICGDNRNCLFDIAATNSLEFGQRTLNSTTTIESDNEVLENIAPEFSVDNLVFNMTLGEVFTYNVTATDANGDDLNIDLEGLPAGATTTRSGNSLIFSWLVDSTDQLNMTFTVTDTKNASSELVPKINICACKPATSCYIKPPSSQLTALVFTNHYVMDCKCPIGYTGRFCETVKDFCQSASGSPCHPLVNCTNSPTQYICGPCPTGYGGDGQNCSDIDECTRDTDNCQMLCDNTAGSFECRCNSGYRLNADKKNCDDINECVEGHECMHICANTQGSYTCSCNTNFIVHPNNSRDCIPKVNCPSGHGCQDVCFIEESTNAQTCSCNRGFKLQADRKSCTDVDECSDKTDLCTQTCTNSRGSYTCSCIQGYRLLTDTRTCEDIDECAENATTCSSAPGEKCFNLPGSFKCDCNGNQGLVRINGTCQVPPDNTVVPAEPAPEPPVATQNQINNAVQFRLSSFQSKQWVKSTDSAFKKSLAEALTSYCNANEERRTECGLPRGGFVFSELNVNRLPGNPVDDGSDSLVSFYVVYPDGVKSETNVPVPQSALLNAATEHLKSIEKDTGQTLTITTEEVAVPRPAKDNLDWPLTLGVTIAAVLLLIMGICVLIFACSKRGFTMQPKGDHYASRRWSFSTRDPSHPMSDESYRGFDQDGLPVDMNEGFSSA